MPLMQGGKRMLIQQLNGLNEIPQITVITISYNEVTTIEQTIKSVIGQTGVRLEYLVIDGGSKDGTVDHLMSYDHHIDFWLSEKDSGIYDAMNKGIAQAKGEWLFFLNAGDKILDGGLRKLLALSIEHKHAEIITGRINIFDFLGSNLAFIHPNVVCDSNLLKYSCCIAHPATLVRSSVFKKIGPYDTDYRIAGDYEFWLRALKNKIIFHFDKLIVSDFNGNGLSSRREFYLKNLKETLKARVHYGYISAHQARLQYSKNYMIFFAKNLIRLVLGAALTKKIQQKKLQSLINQK
jgi:glycosyltransferase involved in cell wall biosynthesis